MPESREKEKQIAVERAQAIHKAEPEEKRNAVSEKQVAPPQKKQERQVNSNDVGIGI